MAVIKALEYFNDGYDWIVDIDLQSFFDEVNQDKLIGIIRRTVKDGNLVSLIRKFLQSGVMENGVLQPNKKGTPQGGNQCHKFKELCKKLCSFYYIGFTSFKT